MQRITPSAWFSGHADVLVEFYTSVFRNSKIGKITKYGEEEEEKV